jgi:hypothetical protein
MKEYRLGRELGLQWTVMPLAIAGAIGLWLVATLLMAAVFHIQIVFAAFGGVLVVFLHELSETVHQLGHEWAARRTGYPMSGVRFGVLGIFAASVYPPDEPALPAQIHIRRALGGPLFSAGLSALAFVLLIIYKGAVPHGQFVLWFFFLDNFFVMTLQVFIPLGFNDGATIWHWLRQR